MCEEKSQVAFVTVRKITGINHTGGDGLIFHAPSLRWYYFDLFQHVMKANGLFEIRKSSDVFISANLYYSYSTIC